MPRNRSGRIHIAVIGFLVAFAVGFVALSYYYLFPALQAFVEAKQQGDKSGQKAISATSELLLAILLVILIAGLILTFRIGRFFFPRETAPRTRTKYVDAWAESAKRMQTPSADDE